MPAPGNARTGPFEDAVALYSQHLARPPAAPPTGSKLQQARKRAQRRPRSAVAILTSPLTPAGSSSTTQPSGGRYLTQSVQRDVRTSSAAATVIKTRLPTRPARRRPATAGGTAKNSRTSVPGGNALRRRVVSAGNAPSSRVANYRRDKLVQNKEWSSPLEPENTSHKISHSNNSADGVIAHDSTWGHDIDVAVEPEVGEAGVSGGAFWHRHGDLSLDPKVVENILEGRKNTRGGVGLSPPQFLANTASARSPYQENSRPSTNHTDGRRKPGPSRRQRPKWRVVGAAESSLAAGSTRSVVGNQDMHCLTKVNERAEEHVPGDPTRAPQSTRTYSYPSEDERGVCEGDHEAVIGMLGVPENSGGGGSGGGDTRAEETCGVTPRARNSNTQSGEISSALTPLALDVFSSLRPTLELRAKCRPTSSAGGRCTSRKNCRSRGIHPTMGENAPHVWKGLANSRTSVPQPHQPLIDRKVCTWMSVFGAVRAGAERSRARAEVLEAARREIRKPQSIQATNARVNVSRDEVLKEASVTAIAALSSAESTIDEVAGGGFRRATSNAFADHNNPHGSQAIPPIEENETTGRQPDKKSEGGSIFMICDVDYITPLEIDVAKESPEGCFSQGVPLQPPTAELTPRSATTASIRSTAQAESLPSPLFRPPAGSTITRVGTNTPCRLQVSPGGQRFTGLELSTYTPFRQCPAGSTAAMMHSGRRPSTAGGATCGDATENHKSCGRSAIHPRGAVRPATSGGFFNTSVGKQEGVGGVNSRCGQGFTPAPARCGSTAYGMTDGSALRHRVDQISEGIVKDLQLRPDAPSRCTKYQVRGDPLTEPGAIVHPRGASGVDLRDSEQTACCIPQSVEAAPLPPSSVIDTLPCSGKELQGLAVDPIGCKHLGSGTEPNETRSGGTRVSIGDQEDAKAAVGCDLSNQTTGLPAPDAHVDAAAFSSRKRRRPRPAPVAKDTPTDCVRPRSFSEGYSPGVGLARPRRSTSCPVVFQEVSSWTFLPRRNHGFHRSQPLTLEEIPQEHFRTSTDLPRRGHDDGKLADARSVRGVKVGSSGECGDGTDAASKGEHSRKTAKRNEEQRHFGRRIMKTGVVGTPSMETGAENRKVGVPEKVTTALDFQNAAVKLKFFAAESGAAIDGHEMAWALSKVEAEMLFNDYRLVAEEDAQEAGKNAELETRRRLYRVVTQFGLEESVHAEKKAALEEAQRVLQQDTRMYAARMEASERMTEEMRVLEADNDDADMMFLLEQRRNQTLLKMKERTEREIDERRAGCQRLRERANVMGTTLEEARHARGLLVGHVQHIVERMACQAERVSVTRRWCQDRLKERRHARATSRSINRQFERKSKELDLRLRKNADRGTVLTSKGHQAAAATAAAAAALAENTNQTVPAVHAVLDTDHGGGAFAELEGAAMRLRALLALCAAVPGSCIASYEEDSVQSPAAIDNSFVN